MAAVQVNIVELKEPFTDLKPGTSGLRKKVKTFQQAHYTESFIQAILDAIQPHTQGACLVVGGDGRYYSKEAIQLIIKIAAANGVSNLIIGQEGIFSTPAVSNLIRKRACTGGIILTASHNPGGPNADFGIKYNSSNGGPASEQLTDKIYELSKSMKHYKILAVPDVDISSLGKRAVGQMEIEIVDSVADYVELMKQVFDFDLLKQFFRTRPDFTVLFDGMHGVTGPYGKAIFNQELGLPDAAVMNGVPLPDFGNGHPDPNLTYAHELVELVRAKKISLGAASDGDGDRNMIIAHDAFVNPSDSVASMFKAAVFKSD